MCSMRKNTFRILLFSLLSLKLFTKLNSAGNKTARSPEVSALQTFPNLFNVSTATFGLAVCLYLHDILLSKFCIVY